MSRPVVWGSESLVGPLCRRLGTESTIVGTPDEFVEAERDGKAPSFVDVSAIEALDRFAANLSARTDQTSSLTLRRLMSSVSSGPIIVMCEPPLQMATTQLTARPWLSHLLSTSVHEESFATQHFRNIFGFCATRKARLLEWLQPADAGRRVRFTHANRCGERLDRMGQFFASKGLDPEVVQRLRDVAQELLANAFYAAPVAASASKFIDRNSNVALPDDYPCDLAYGCHDALAMVRVRDPFGALSRERLIGALGAGSGLAKVFSSVSILAASTVRSRITEVFAAVPTSGVPTPVAFHFFNKDGPGAGRWRITNEDTGVPVADQSVTLTFSEQP